MAYKIKLTRSFWLVPILVLGFGLRLYKIDNPLADWHSWRQADTAAVTRNFVKHGIDILRPRFDDLSDLTGKGLFNPQGYRMVEFPLFNLFHLLLYQLFPIKSLEFWGRMTAVISAVTSAGLLFAIGRRMFGETVGLIASFLYLVLPYNIYFTRVVLPDPMMVTFFLAATWFSLQWSRQPRARWLVATVLFGAGAALIKPAAVFFLLPAVWQFRGNLKRFVGVGLGMVLPLLVWRWWEHRYPSGIPYSLWLLNGNKIRFKGAFFRWLFGERLGSLILGKWGIWPFLTGVTAAIGPLWPWLAGAAVYLVVFATGNVHHDYYQIPLIPVVSLAVAIGVVKLARTWMGRVTAGVCVLFMLAFSWYDVRGNYQVNHWEIIEAGQAVDRLVPPDAVVVAPYGGDTAFLYQTKRRGFPNLSLPIKDLIDRFGAQYYVSVNLDDQTRAIMNKYTVVEQAPRYVIVKLVEPIRP